MWSPLVGSGSGVARQNVWQGWLVADATPQLKGPSHESSPTIPAEKKLRIVLSVLQGEVTVAEAARREKFSEQAIGNWKRQFLEGVDAR